MKVEILNRFTGEVIVSGKYESVKDALEKNRSADLRYADLRSADLDFSALPLWCGSFNMKVDINIVRQLLYHICKLENESKEFKEIKKIIKPFANKAGIIKRHSLDKIK